MMMMMQQNMQKMQQGGWSQGGGGKKGKAKKKAKKPQQPKKELTPEEIEEKRKKAEERWAAKIAEEQRVVVSRTVYEGEVVMSAKQFAWVKPLTSMNSVPRNVQDKLKAMNDEARQKAAEAKGGKKFCDGIETNVVYVGNGDLV